MASSLSLTHFCYVVIYKVVMHKVPSLRYLVTIATAAKTDTTLTRHTTLVWWLMEDVPEAGRS